MEAWILELHPSDTAKSKVYSKEWHAVIDRGISGFLTAILSLTLPSPHRPLGPLYEQRGHIPGVGGSECAISYPLGGVRLQAA